MRGETFFRNSPQDAADKPQFKCPDEKLWEDKEEERGPSQGSGKSSQRKVCQG